MSAEEPEELPVGFAARGSDPLKQEKERSSEKKARAAFFAREDGTSGESIFWVHRRAEGLPPDLATVPDTEGLKERLLRRSEGSPSKKEIVKTQRRPPRRSERSMTGAARRIYGYPRLPMPSSGLFCGSALLPPGTGVHH